MKLRLILLGTPEFAVESFEAIRKNGYDIAAVVTMPDKPAGRGHRLLQSPVKQWALEHDLPVLQPTNLKDEDFIKNLRNYKANLFVVIAFRMLPKVVWQMPELGTFNLHASLLPRYRGAAPINHAVMNGDTLTGVTSFFLKHEIDTGDILCQRSIEIGPEETAGSVHDRLMHLGSVVTLETLKQINEGTVKPISQEKLITQGEEATPAPKIFRETCMINWNQPAEKIRNFVRGLAPYPASWSTLSFPGLGNVDAKIFEVRKTDKPISLLPGNIRITDGKIYVGTLDGLLEILSLQVPGKKRLNACEFLNGLHLL